MAFGKLLAVVGIILLIIGLCISYAPWTVNWFGKLPGDIRIEGERNSVFIPITSMLILSIILSLIINVFFRK